MNKKNIALIQPCNPAKIHDGPYFIKLDKESYSLSLSPLESYLKKNGFTTILLPGDITEDELISIVEKIKPFAIGFSTYTYAFNKSLRFAKAIKQKAKKLRCNIFTIFGGYHASGLPQKTASQPEVDFVVKGEGEITFVELLNALLENKDPSKIPGLFFKQNDNVIKTPERKRIENLDSLPYFERHHEIITTQKDLHITYPSFSQQVGVASIAYSRGCPFNCSFCSSNNLWSDKLIFRSTASVIKEIETLIQNYGTNLVRFLDLTFNANKKKALELCKELIKKDLPVYWTAMVRMDLIDEEFIKFAKEAKCTKLQIGIESSDKNTATKLKDKYKLQQDHMIKMLNLIDSLGIIIKAYLIIGLENDSKESILRNKEEMLKFPFDEMTVAFATPLPGSYFFDQSIKKKLIMKNPQFDDFTLEQPVIKTQNISQKDLFALRRMIGGLFASPVYFEHVKKKIINFPYLKKSWLEGFKIYESMGFFKGFENELSIFLSKIKQLS